MKTKLIISMAISFLLGGTLVSSAQKLGVDPIDDVIKAMTLEEKVRILIGNGMKGLEEGAGAVVGETEDLVPGAAGTTYAIPRLGIPSIVLADGPAGLRINPTRKNDDKTYYATHFPIGTLLASTWDTELVENVGRAIGNEVLEYGVDVLLAPGMNIQRNPLNGRNFEYYSEDPLLTGKIAAAYVNGVQKNGVGTSVKHFVANNQETNRTATDAIISQRAIREIYLKGFEIALKESNPWTLMTSYNLLNGIYTSENPELLLTLLRNEWDYDGMVMTDWFGGKNAPAQVRAGNDMLQPGYKKQYDDIIEAVNNGELDQKDIDRNVRRVLELVLKTPRFKGYRYSNNPNLHDHAEITRKSATEGMILLKNENSTLPLKSSVKNIALFGTTSYDFIPGGTGSGNVNRAYTISLLEGLQNANYIVDENLKNLYEKHIAEEIIRLKPKDDDKLAHWLAPAIPDEMIFSDEQFAKFAQDNNAAIITIGRNSGEFADRLSSDFYMTENMLRMIETVSKAFKKVGKPVIVILNIGGAIETASWKESADAILLAWQGGQEGGNSVVDILSGEINPSGKLTMTFPLKVTDPYSSLNFPMNSPADMSNFFDMDRTRGNVKNIDYTMYEEDVFVGYRYFDTFDVPVSFPFGFGLSYTSFKYGEPVVSLNDGIYNICVDITNSGERAGKEIVQLYVSSPWAKEMNEPVKALKAFAKTSLLAPGETQTVNLCFPASEIAFFDEEASSWITKAGEYTFIVGASSVDVKRTLKVKVDDYSKKVDNLFKPQGIINLLKR